MGIEREFGPETESHMERVPPGSKDVLQDEQPQSRYKLVLGKVRTFPEGTFGHQIAYFFFASGDEAARKHVAERLEISYPFNEIQFRVAGGWRLYRVSGDQLIELPAR